MVRPLIAVTALALTCAVASAQPAAAPAPATAPAATTTTQAAIPSDQSTPKSALKVLADAMESGERAAILGVLHAVTPQETRMAEAMADLAGALAMLRKEAVEAFGPEGAKALTGDVAAVAAQGLARLGAATERIDGDKATVMVGEGQGADPPVNLIRHDGKWKYPMSEMAKGAADPAQIDQGIADAAEQVKLLKEAAAEVREKKYKTAEEVRAALEQRVMQMVLARQQAATQKSTTAPATTPQQPPAALPPASEKPAP